MTGKAEMQGNKLPVIDSLLVATALTYDLILVTRNVDDIAYASTSLNTGTNVKFINPFTS